MELSISELNINPNMHTSELSINLYAVDADNRFLQEAALNSKVEILDITGTTISSRSDSLSISSE